MTKTIALHFPATKLTEILQSHGYQVINLAEATLSNCHIDALLLNADCPERTVCCHQLPAAADITIGNGNTGLDDIPHTIVINITGMYPEQIINLSGVASAPSPLERLGAPPLISC